MKNQSEIKHALRMKFGLSPDEPTEEQYQKIKNDISSHNNFTSVDLPSIVKNSCQSFNTYMYKGYDNSKIMILLSLLIADIKNEEKK